jgi:hypothetical protein
LKTVVQALSNGLAPFAGEVHLDGIGVSEDIAASAVTRSDLCPSADLCARTILHI